MKKLLPFFSLIFLLSNAQITRASHMLGGEITWQCLANGQYQFFAKVYRDCTGISFPFQDLNLQIVGNPLPSLTLNGPAISGILIKPDSAAWIANNYGDISPQAVGSTSPSTISCANSDAGAVQEFPYASDLIRLYGTPPAGGWKFYITLPCCRPSVTNLASSGTMLLRAEMYPPSTAPAAGQCYDSSPQFYASPQYAFCRGSRSTKQFAAFDIENDSLVFNFNRPYNAPHGAPQAVPYQLGYSPTNPTPDTAFHPNNIAAQLNNSTGLINFTVISGSPLVSDYAVVNEVTAYRNGRLLAKVFRELPIVMFDCPGLPNNAINQKPDLNIANSPQGLEIDVFAGQNVSLPLLISDTDSSASGLQNIRLTAQGMNFANDFSNPSLCASQPCATFLGNLMNYDTTRQEYAISNLASISTTFSWQTSCAHLGSNGEKQTYRFYLQAQDDHSPIPKVENGYIIVNVYPAETDEPADFCGALSGTDLALNWNNTGIDSTAFVSWRVYKRIGSGSFQLIDTLANYQITAYLDQNYNSSSSSDYLVRPAHNSCGVIREGRASEVFSNTYLSSPQLTLNGNTFSTTSTGDFQWYNCDSSKVVANETSSSFSPQAYGNYALILSRGGCEDTTNCVSYFAVGLNEISLADQLTIYPNPSNGKVFIDRAGLTSLDYQIFNIQGKLMKRGRLAADQNQLELPEAEGLYFVSFRDTEGNEKTYKLIKQ